MARALKARALLNENLCSAAYFEARAVARERPISWLAWETMTESLLREGLDGTAAYRDADAGRAKAREEQEKRVPRPPK